MLAVPHARRMRFKVQDRWSGVERKKSGRESRIQNRRPVSFESRGSRPFIGVGLYPTHTLFYTAIAFVRKRKITNLPKMWKTVLKTTRTAVWASTWGVVGILLYGWCLELLWAQPQAEPRVADEMAGLKASLPASDWKGEEQAWTPEMFLKAATLLGQRERAEKVVENCSDGHSLVWLHRTDARRQTVLGVLRFRGADGARSYFGLAADLQRQQDEKIRGGCGTDRCVLDSRARAVTVAGADEAFCIERRWEVGGTTITVCQLWARKGCRVLEFSWYGGPADLPWAGRVHQELIRKVTAS